MTVATDPRDPLDPTERELAKRLARLPQPEPAAELDARILAAARAAVTPQRRPRWGWHPEQPGLALLNGLGSRGTLHAPMLAEELWRARRD